MLRPAPLFAATLALSITAAGLGADQEWKQWRGPAGTGHAPASNPPIEWSATKNVKWKVAVPGEGHASPIVLGDRIYLMTAVKTDRKVETSEPTAPEAADAPPPGRGDRGRGGRGGRGAMKPTNVHEFKVLAVDRKTGEIVWNTTVREEVPHEGTHQTGSLAGGSPVTDGAHIYASFGSRGVYCLDMSGAVKWEKDLGDMRIRNGFGEGASPALHGNTLVVPWDHEGESFVVALDAKTGAEKWRVDRDERTTWTTPVIVEVDGAAQAVVAGTTATVSYALETGDEVWRCSGLTMNVIPTPVVGHGMIYLMSGFRGSALQAIRLDKARGDVSGTDAIVWSHGRGTPYVPSSLLSGRNLYFLRSNNAVISCFDAITGEEHYSGERIEGLANVYASPVGGGGRVYVCGREGNVVVLEDGPVFKVLATNSIGEGIDATPAIVGDVMYLRGSKHLFCIAETGAAARE